MLWEKGLTNIGDELQKQIEVAISLWVFTSLSLLPRSALENHLAKYLLPDFLNNFYLQSLDILLLGEIFIDLIPQSSPNNLWIVPFDYTITWIKNDIH